MSDCDCGDCDCGDCDCGDCDCDCGECDCDCCADVSCDHICRGCCLCFYDTPSTSTGNCFICFDICCFGPTATETRNERLARERQARGELEENSPEDSINPATAPIVEQPARITSLFPSPPYLRPPDEDLPPSYEDATKQATVPLPEKTPEATAPPVVKEGDIKTELPK